MELPHKINELRFLVTGGAGFIGSNIVEELVARGCFVRVLDNFSTGKRENLSSFKDDIEIVEGDIRSYHLVQRATEGIDVVLHQAALPSVPRSIFDPITTNEVNAIGTLNVLEAARQANVKRLVFASSSSVYGDNPVMPKQEGMTPCPLSPYAVSKLTGEHYCQVFSKIYGLSTIALRYFNVFGPRQDPDSQYSAVIPKFIRKISENERPVIFGDGEQSRDFTYIGNVVQANLLAATSDCDGGFTVNCACGEQKSLNQLVRELGVLMGRELEPEYADPRPGDVKHSLADIGRAKVMLNYEPSISFETGLAKTVKVFEESNTVRKPIPLKRGALRPPKMPQYIEPVEVN